VTLSVVRQLDWADPADVEPFGRVKTGEKPPGRVHATGGGGFNLVKSAESIEIVGSAAGVLVRSVFWCTVLTCTSGGTAACPEIRAINAELDRYKVRGQPPPHMTPEYEQVINRLAAHDVHDWTRYDPDQRTYEMWASLPLIVLAGLR
jgi:hypothetical protein